MAKHPYHELIDAFDQLPGVGPKAAQRIADACLNYKLSDNASEDDAFGLRLQAAVDQAISRLQYCATCQSLLLDGDCRQCHQATSKAAAYCVVETNEQANQLLDAELAVQFFVLHGVLSPTSGVGPQQLQLHKLVQWLTNLPASEIEGQSVLVYFMLPDSIEGQITTDFMQRSINKVRNDIQCQLSSSQELHAVLDSSSKGSS